MTLVTALDKKLVKMMDVFEISCYHVDKNKNMKELGIDVSDPTLTIEFDILGIINGDIGIIFETTSDANGNLGKIQRFIDKCESFVDAHKKNKIDFKKFKNLSPGVITKLKKIKQWKRVYLGIGDELLEKNIHEGSFTEREDLTILNSEHMSYLEFLADRLRKYGKGEFLKKLEITLEDPEDPRNELAFTAIQLENKKISGNIDVEVFLFQAPAEDLLEISLVPRYGSLQPWAPEYGDDTYQRLLNKNKILSLAKMIEKGKGLSSFPNALSVVLTDEIDVKSTSIELVKKLTIPKTYGAIEIIDGQHRLFAYASTNLKKDQIRKSKLVVVGLRFKEQDIDKRRQLAAKTFVEINREQTKVPNELIYLISNISMGEITPVALAARVLSLLNRDLNSPLRNVFHTRPFQKKNRSGGKPVKLVMVSNELARLFRSENKTDTDPSIQNLYKSFPIPSWNNLIKRKNAKGLIEKGQELVNEYFKVVSDIFKEDWNSSESYIFSSKYMTAFMRLFIEYKKKDYDNVLMGKSLAKLKQNLINYVKVNPEDNEKPNPHSITLWRNYQSIPRLKSHPTEIIDFIISKGA